MTRTVSSPPDAKGGSPSRTRTLWLPLGLVGLGLGAALVALLGPLAGGVIEYHVSEGARNQVAGGDVAGLFLVAPVSLLAALFVWRRHPAGPPLALPPAAYGLYMYSQLALGGDVARYPGNSERFFPLYLGLFLLAGAIAVTAWPSIDAGRFLPRGVERTLGVFFLVVAGFLLLGLHLPGLLDAWSDQPTSTEYAADPVVFWLVKFMDLGIVVPLLVVSGVGLIRAAPWAARFTHVAAGWAALLGTSVAGMAIVMQVTGDPGATTANTVAFGAFALIALVMAWLVYRPMLRAPSGGEASPGRHASRSDR